MERESAMNMVFDGDKVVGLFIHQETASQRLPSNAEIELVRIFSEYKALRQALSRAIELLEDMYAEVPYEEGSEWFDRKFNEIEKLKEIRNGKG